jgi:tRNA dimethylallyltransferase
MWAQKKTLYVISGFTAVGKTNYAIDFAEKNNGEIVSCDSLLVYKHMDIGTAKPTELERRGIRHHCIDLVEPSERFNVSMFVDSAKAAISSILSAGKIAIVVGGSGFYLKSLYFPIVDGIKVPEEVENFVDEEFKASGLDGIVAMLISANDGVCPSVDVRNPRRVMAALKRCLASGKTCDDVQMEFNFLDSAFSEYEKVTIFLERGRDDLEFRVRERARKMIASGLVDEVKFLLSKYENLSDSAKNAIGYRETISWLKNPTTEKDLVDEISQNTMKLIKKQRTWFRKYIPIDEKFFLL